MVRKIAGFSRNAMLMLGMAGAMLALMPAVHAADQNDLASAVKDKLHADKYKDVQVSVDENGIATLSGTVDLFVYKQDAERAAHKVKGVKAVQDNIEVGGNSVADEDIAKKLGPQLAYSREGYGNLFDAIIMNVQNGVVTLSGHSHDYANRDAAVGLASSTPGVKEVIDDIQVDPVSPMDDGIRLQVARAIYGYPALNRYAIDPIRPIRIAVQNGHVQLYGAVDSAMDKNLAFMQAKQVPGVFSVDNYIQVRGQPNEKENRPGAQTNEQGETGKNKK